MLFQVYELSRFLPWCRGPSLQLKGKGDMLKNVFFVIGDFNTLKKISDIAGAMTRLGFLAVIVSCGQLEITHRSKTGIYLSGMSFSLEALS
ncbi:hypothetical protein V7795_23160 [Rhizobium laguerreae]|uniref:hypothetical protein n=1 Tax=Rhizobium laguerreae TaxID=1076926 RepID=UPI0030005558